ncbi:MAG TPA: FkbM family methyltransferase [Flavobacterium sp.]|jgi:FkbM family methyltransferase
MEIPNLICFDVGARNGLCELKQLSKYISLFSFEPNIHESDSLASTGSSSGYRQFNLVDKGLYSSEGNHKLYLMANPSMSSLLKPDENVLDEYFGSITEFSQWRKQLKIIRDKTIETTTIDIVAQSHEIDSIDYLKLDTQGTELEILKGAEKMLQDNKILVIKTEFAFIPFYKGQPVFTEVDLFLKNLGYKLINCEFQYDATSPFTTGEKPKWGLGGDAYYCVDFDKVKDQQKMQRAGIILSGLGFQSNAAFLFDKLNIAKQEQSRMFNIPVRKDKKAIAKYLLPPILLHWYKQLKS